MTAAIRFSDPVEIRHPLLPEVGDALWGGKEWQHEMAVALGVNPRRVRAWVAGEEPVPEGVWRELHEMLRQQAVENARLSGQLHEMLRQQAVENARLSGLIMRQLYL